MQVLVTADLKQLFVSISEVMSKEKENLCLLDSKVGDGDLGITMSVGFKKIAEKIVQIDEADIGKFIQQAGLILAQSAPSTMGTLLASGFLEAGKALKGYTQMNAAEFTVFINNFKEGLMKRGKAKPGEKTVVDVFDYCSQAIKNKSGELSLVQIAEVAEKGAYKGLEATKQMMSVHGKAAVFREKTLGLLDPGATAAWLIIKTVFEFISKQRQYDSNLF